MKKTFLAIAALLATAGASAQSTSSVTLFGVADVSIAHLKSDTNKLTGMSSGGLSSSRLGFRGIEDLGGGLKAGFWFEGGIPVDNGGSGFKFDRRSTVSLMGGFGEVRLGRDKTPAYLNIETFDPFGDVGVGAVSGSNLIGGSSVAVGTPEGSGHKRVSNSVNYILPKMGGFFGQVQYGFGEKPDGIANDRLASSAALRLGYANGPLNVAAAYGVTRGGTDARGVDYKAWNLGASYNFGMVKPMAQFATERGNHLRVDMYLVGATVPLGAGELRAAYSQISTKHASDADTQRFAIGYGYNLSKRTQLYAAIAHIKNDDKAKRGFGVSSSSLVNPTVANGDSATGYEFGVRHSF
ncbi:porin [Diaphorobacter aerolatus]|uniref:Porin n=1 Tax=Diaphorobacter aerolatus TaxID=1288495 RepID=A0A7H0GHU7_9BURK|nr:porin [Diaphorobacter aerolatus]QNP47863.1 porin [Diaphorobacter aerolatus]